MPSDKTTSSQNECQLKGNPVCVLRSAASQPPWLKFPVLDQGLTYKGGFSIVLSSKLTWKFEEERRDRMVS